MTELTTFTNPEFGQVRTIDVDGAPWLVAKDVAAALGYKNSRDAIARHVDEEDKGVVKHDTPSGEQEMVVINESGLYSLVLCSKLPTAKKFKRWVTSEVLPSIRKHGAYMTPQKIEEVLLNPDTIISLAQQLKEEKAKTAKLAPAAEYARNFLLASGGRLVSSIAKDYGMSAQRFNQILNALDIQYRKGGQWMLYQKYTGKGYTETRVNLIPHNDGRTHQHPETLWTARGCAFLSKQLAKAGIFPTKQSEAEKE